MPDAEPFVTLHRRPFTRDIEQPRATGLDRVPSDVKAGQIGRKAAHEAAIVSLGSSLEVRLSRTVMAMQRNERTDVSSLIGMASLREGTVGLMHLVDRAGSIQAELAQKRGRRAILGCRSLARCRVRTFGTGQPGEGFIRPAGSDHPQTGTQGLRSQPTPYDRRLQPACCEPRDRESDRRPQFRQKLRFEPGAAEGDVGQSAGNPAYGPIVRNDDAWSIDRISAGPATFTALVHRIIPYARSRG